MKSWCCPDYVASLSKYWSRIAMFELDKRYANSAEVSSRLAIACWAIFGFLTVAAAVLCLYPTKPGGERFLWLILIAWGISFVSAWALTVRAKAGSVTNAAAGLSMWLEWPLMAVALLAGLSVGAAIAFAVPVSVRLALHEHNVWT